MKPSFALCMDIDHTIAEPCWYDDDLHICKQQYLNAGIVTTEEVAAIERHQRLFFLPLVSAWSARFQQAGSQRFLLLLPKRGLGSHAGADKNR
jgi:hypothetical protein